MLNCRAKKGVPYAGISREQRIFHGHWKMFSWIETGIINSFELIAHMTAEKAGYDHSRSVEELGEVWFIGENAKAEAIKKLESEK